VLTYESIEMYLGRVINMWNFVNFD